MPKKTKWIKVTDRKKTWNKRNQKSVKYPTKQIEREKKFLIVCEGVNTEPEYFKAFPIKTAMIKSFGLGMTKMALVKAVVEMAKSINDKNQEVWIVFDMDIRLENEAQQIQDYNNAIVFAEKKGFKVAYSNDAFELWFLLHYQLLENQWTRHQYYQRLSELWNCNYENHGKHILFCKGIYDKLQTDESANQNQAIQRAESLLEQQKEISFADRNPCTTVFELVRELNKHL